MRTHLTFLKQFREQFETTGAIAPSSQFLAKAMTGPMEAKQGPLRILEVGPGTGAVTRRIVRKMKPEDQLDLVELNETFADLLDHSFENDPAYQKVVEQSRLHRMPLQDFNVEQPYDIIISGLPLNNFPTELVAEIFEKFCELLKPGGTLSYFEYMYIRSAKKRLSKSAERKRLKELDEVIKPYLSEYRTKRSWVFINFPPAWVQHLQLNGTETSSAENVNS